MTRGDRKRARTQGGRVLVACATILAAVSILSVRTVFAGVAGEAAYVQACAPCHGATGRGDGPEAKFFLPPPPDLRGGALAKVTDEQVVARLRDGAPRVLEIDPAGRQDRLRRVEEITAHIQRLPDIDWVQIDAGAMLFSKRCAPCHGPMGRPLPGAALPAGVQKPPRDLWDPAFQRGTSDAELLDAIRHGTVAMPGIPGLQDEAQAKTLLPYLRLLSPGFETYSTFCAPCHGDDGRGDGVLAKGKNRPTVVFDRVWLANRSPQQMQDPVARMVAAHGGQMPHFRGEFSDEQLLAIARFLRSDQTP